MQQTDETPSREPGRGPRATAPRVRPRCGAAHPEIGITTPLNSLSGRWQVSTDDGTTSFSGVWAMLDFLAMRFGAADDD